MKPVVIVGAGLSGLSAGVALASRGIPVSVLEQRPSAGGRANSFTDETTGETIDNGQHVLIAGYHRTLRFLETIGTRSRLAVQPDPVLTFHHPDRGFCRFRLPRLPTPFHLAGGMFTTNLFSLPDKLLMARAGTALARFRESAPGRVAEMTVNDWLDAVGQSDETKRSFWEPLAVSIMNEHCGTASALTFLRALRRAFLSGRRAAAMAIPTVGLSELYVNAAVELITRHGGIVRCGVDVAECLAPDGRVLQIRCRNGETLECSAVILAVPPGKAAAIVPEELRSSGFLADIAAVPYSPIVSVHLWFATDFMPYDFLGVIGRSVQWLFNRRRITGTSAHAGHLSAVISAAHREAAMTNAELVRLVMDDLSAIFGSAAVPPVHAVVIREKRATFACTPMSEHMRPGAETPLGNLFLAGDWTATGLPATIEGAILSGERCADLAGALLF